MGGGKLSFTQGKFFLNFEENIFLGEKNYIILVS
jgi:hypothetical protein